MEIDINEGEEVTEDEKKSIEDIMNATLDTFMERSAVHDAPVWIGFSAIAIFVSRALAAMANDEEGMRILRDDMMANLSTEIESVWRQYQDHKREHRMQ